MGLHRCRSYEQQSLYIFSCLSLVFYWRDFMHVLMFIRMCTCACCFLLCCACCIFEVYMNLPLYVRNISCIVTIIIKRHRKHWFVSFSHEACDIFVGLDDRDYRWVKREASKWARSILVFLAKNQTSRRHGDQSKKKRTEYIKLWCVSFPSYDVVIRSHVSKSKMCKIIKQIL